MDNPLMVLPLPSKVPLNPFELSPIGVHELVSAMLFITVNVLPDARQLESVAKTLKSASESIEKMLPEEQPVSA